MEERHLVKVSVGCQLSLLATRIVIETCLLDTDTLVLQRCRALGSVRSLHQKQSTAKINLCAVDHGFKILDGSLKTIAMFFFRYLVTQIDFWEDLLWFRHVCLGM